MASEAAQLPAVYLTDVVERLLWLDGKPFSFYNYPMHRPIYNGRYKSTILMCGRQVAKSTMLSNVMISESIAIPFFKSYYISPSKEQTLIFSNTRLGKTLSYSPLVRKHFQSPQHADRVLHRSYTNGSENAFSYACDDADRVRGFSADRSCFDEVQDMLYDAVVPVVTGSMKNSKYRYEIFAGTPKTMENSIQYIWERSTQSEWVMKCDGCSKYNYVNTEKSIGKFGIICVNCGTYLNPRNGIWVDMRAQTEVDVDISKGFHIPQPIMPENNAICFASPEEKEIAHGRWKDILKDMSMFSPAKFKNEVLGVSDAQGARLISLDELRRLCVGGSLSPTPTTQNRAGVTQTFGGVDWFGGGTSGRSRTVAWIFGWDHNNQKLRTLWFKIYPGNNAVEDVDDIVRTFSFYQVAMAVGDAGGGALPNSLLRQKLGAHRVTQLQYGMYDKPIKWGEDRYLADRTTLIDNYIMLLKGERVSYPPYEESRVMISDILNVYEETTKSGKKVWRHSMELPDDCLHAQLYAWVAWKIVMGDLKFYA